MVARQEISTPKRVIGLTAGSVPRLLFSIGLLLIVVAFLLYDGTIPAMIGIYGMLFVLGSIAVYGFPFVIKTFR